MSTLKINDVFMYTGQEDGVRKRYRILWINQRSDRLWIIRIPEFGTDSEYYRSPLQKSLSQYEQKLADHAIAFSQSGAPPIFGWSDEKICERFGKKDGTCSLLTLREKRWDWLKDLIGENSIGDVLEAGLIPSWTKKLEREKGIKRAKAYSALHCYLASGLNKNSLMGNGWRSGARGKARAPKTKFKDGKIPTVYPLSKDDKEKIKFAWRHYRLRNSSNDAFLEMLGVFYSNEEILYDGKFVPVHLPPGKRPSYFQFKTWGPTMDPASAGWRLKITDSNYINNFKGMTGTAQDGISAVGQISFCDSTSNDVILRSIASRSKIVGTATRLMIIEGKSGLVVGFYVGFEPPSYKTFLMAVAHAAQSKVEYCRRFKVEVTDDMFPRHASRVYYGDNGEYRSKMAMNALEKFGSTIEYEPSGTPRMNPIVESNHHLFHARIDHKLPGTTHGKERERGQQNPAFDSCLNYFEYMHEFIKAVIYYNTQEVVDIPLIEMRRDKVKPNRLAIYNWYVENGYIVDLNPDCAALVAHLYPALPAVLHANGIYLKRSDRGEKNELVGNLRFMSDYLIDNGLLDAVRKNGVKNVTVRGIPENPSDMWLETDEGLQKLTVLSNDPILVTEATMADCMAMLDEDREERRSRLSEDEQNKSNLLHSRTQNIADAKEDKIREMGKLPRKMTKTEQLDGIAGNRKAEIGELSTMGLTTDLAKGEKVSVGDASSKNRSDASGGMPIVKLTPADLAMKRYKEAKNDKARL